VAFQWFASQSPFHQLGVGASAAAGSTCTAPKAAIATITVATSAATRAARERGEFGINR
jgi:hypothetical protein